MTCITLLLASSTRLEATSTDRPQPRLPPLHPPTSSPASTSTPRAFLLLFNGCCKRLRPPWRPLCSPRSHRASSLDPILLVRTLPPPRPRWDKHPPRRPERERTGPTATTQMTHRTIHRQLIRACLPLRAKWTTSSTPKEAPPEHLHLMVLPIPVRPLLLLSDLES